MTREDQPNEVEMEDTLQGVDVELPPSNVPSRTASMETMFASNTETLRTTNTAQPVHAASIFDIFTNLSDDSGERSADRMEQGARSEDGLDNGKPPLAPIPRPEPAHHRVVSWGQNKLFDVPDAAFEGRFVNNSLHQPKISDLSQVEGMLPSFLPPPRPYNEGPIEVDDLHASHPFESEAETYILEAIERHGNAETEPLPSITDEAVQTLSSLEDDEREAATLSPNPSLLDQTATGTSSSRPRQRHRRTETMEQKLFGLTSAMDAIHAMHSDNVPDDDPIVRDRANTLESMPEVNNEPLTAGHALSQNAGILYQRKPPANGGSVVEDRPGSSVPDNLANNPQRRQGFKRTTDRLHPKKHDDTVVDTVVEGNETDVEKGDEQPSLTGNVEDDEPAQKPQTLEQESPPWYHSNPMSDWKFFKEFQEFFSPRKDSIYSSLKSVGLYVMFPALGVAVILFYFAGNPPTGVLINRGRPNSNGELINREGLVVDPSTASASWWLIFLCVRQLITFVLSKATEIILVDFLSVRTKVTVKALGPWATLLILQSKGWPFLLSMWAIFDFALLSGSKPFFSHWAYWQSLFGFLNASNPSGGIVDSTWNHRVISIAASLGVIVGLKRLWLGLYLGRQTYAQFSSNLATCMKKILLISEVASLSKEMERSNFARGYDRPFSTESSERLQGLLAALEDDGSTANQTTARSERSGRIDSDVTQIIDPEDRHRLTGSLSSTQKDKVSQLLGAWEEPHIRDEVRERVSVNAILQFRRALALLRTDYPFSGSFGLANTREDMVESCQEVYQRLKTGTPEAEPLTFETLAVLGVLPNKGLDQPKLKEIIRLFRPDRDGKIHLLDFVKAVDGVYRDLRLLRAAVSSSGKIDHAFENIFNVVFYAVVATIMLSFLGLDPLALFLSFSGVVLAFAFMISSASSKYFEGLLFILVRRPYAVGHGIHISNVEVDTSSAGSPWWLVEDVTLFTTTVVSQATAERATLSNGSLANSRIINASRSPAAKLFILVKFPVDVPYDKLRVCHSAIEQYVRNRPREWLKLLGFRATRVEADQGYIEYIVVVQHRDSWDRWGVLQLSKADLSSFCLELSKQLHIQYKSPRLPVDLSLVNGVNTALQIPAGLGPGSSSITSPRPYDAPDLSGLQAQFAPKSKDV